MAGNNTKANNGNGLFVLGSLYPKVTGGMEIFNYYFLKYRLSVLGKRDYYWTVNELPGFQSLHVKVRDFRPTRLFHPLQLFFALLKYRSKIKYIYTGYARQSWVIPYFSAVVFRLFRTPYIITIHSGGIPEWKYNYPYRYYFKHATAVVGVSESICADYGKLAERNDILYIPPLIPFERSQKPGDRIKREFGLSPEDKVLLYVGSLKQMKNPDKVLAAFGSLGKDFLRTNQLKLVFAGAGDMISHLEKYVADHDLKEFVLLAGLINRETVPDFFAMADYYIISSDYEGTSVSLLEAMYNKLPIISADSPGLNTMLQANRNALLYPAHDISRLADCIRQFAGDKVLCKTFGEQAYEDFRAKYSYESMIEKYETLFSKVD